MDSFTGSYAADVTLFHWVSIRLSRTVARSVPSVVPSARSPRPNDLVWLRHFSHLLDIGLSPNTKDEEKKPAPIQPFAAMKCSLIEILLDRGATTEDISLYPLFREAEQPNPALFDKILTLLLIHGVSLERMPASALVILQFMECCDARDASSHEGGLWNVPRD